MKRLIQFLTVTFAVCMLAAYVAYSQKQHNRTIASGSKVAAPPELSMPPVAQTNNPTKAPSNIPIPSPAIPATSHGDMLMMSSSKSMIHVVDTATVSNLRTGASDSEWVSAMTSKSGHVFGQGAVGLTPSLSLALTNPANGHFTYTQTNFAKTNAYFSKEP